MYFYIVHDGSTSTEEVLESIFRLSNLPIMGLTKALRPD